MWMSFRNTNREQSGRAARVNQSPAPCEVELLCQCHTWPGRDPGHRLEESFESFRISVDGIEDRLPRPLDLVLRKPCLKGLRQMSPVSIEATVRHSQQPTHERWIAAVQEGGCVGRIGGASA